MHKGSSAGGDGSSTKRAKRARRRRRRRKRRRKKMMRNKGANEVNGGNTLRGKCAIRERVRYGMLIKRSTIFEGALLRRSHSLPLYRNFVNLSPIIVKIGCINSVACALTQFCPGRIFFIFAVLRSTMELRKLASPRTATSLEWRSTRIPSLLIRREEGKKSTRSVF